MPNSLVIVARIEAKKDSVDLVKRELLKLIEPTRIEEGCMQYDLHQDNDKPEVFLFYEKWETRDLWQLHMNNPNLAAYVKATDGHIADFTVSEMSRIESA